jgi:FlaA1/EpsC-like NDP-sugar epimerase
MITQDTAIDLVIKAGIISEGGEIFIFKMPVVNIDELADVMIERCGKATKEIIGKKPGEKMYEEIMTEEEMSRAYEGKEMYVIYPQIKVINYNHQSVCSRVTSIQNSSQMRSLSKQEIISLLDVAGL